MSILKPYNSKAIIHNVELVFKTGNIEKLNNPTYKFIYLLSGFIAHYNLQGFQSAYSDLRLFANNLLVACDEGSERRSVESWKQYGEEYSQSKARAIKGIREVVTKYQEKITQETEKSDIDRLTNLRDIISEVLRRNDPKTIQALVHRLELK